MNYSVAIPGFEGQSLEVQPAGIFSSAKLLVNGQPAAKGPKRGQMSLRRNDGREAIASWKSNFFDVPKLIVDGASFNVAEPLRWYQWAWGGLPLLLIFMGGALGALCGGIGFAANAKILRSDMNGFLKYALSLAITLFVTVAYVALAVILTSMVNGGSA